MSDAFFWSDEDKNKVAALLQQGLSAGKIAAHFTGVSRNAIIGVVSRDKRLKASGLSGRATRKPTPPKTTRRVSPTVIRRAKAPAPPAIPRVVKPDLAAPPSRDLLLADLTPGQCKWPVNDPPKGEPYRFCGCERAGPSYCAYHATKSVRPHVRAVDSVDRA